MTGIRLSRGKDRSMKTIEEIIAAARQLSSAQLLRLRQKLDRLEESVWQAELDRTTAALRKAKLTDRRIDELVTRRRREGRR
jgi:hypothetical protein